MLNENALHGLIEESQDLHSDAMAGVTGTLSDLVEVHHQAPKGPLDPALLERINRERRTFLSRTSVRLASAGLIGTGIGGPSLVYWPPPHRQTLRSTCRSCRRRCPWNYWRWLPTAWR